MCSAFLWRWLDETWCDLDLNQHTGLELHEAWLAWSAGRWPLLRLFHPPSGQPLLRPFLFQKRIRTHRVPSVGMRKILFLLCLDTLLSTTHECPQHPERKVRQVCKSPDAREENGGERNLVFCSLFIPSGQSRAGLLLPPYEAYQLPTSKSLSLGAGWGFCFSL